MSELTMKLGRLLNAPPESIEILPGDGSEWLSTDLPAEQAQHAPFLFIEGNLGVPQKLAYKAFLDSVPVFRRCRAHLLLPRSPASETRLAIEDMLASSAVLLLVNPAHQSALNVRRQLVLDGALAAERELRFVAALLTMREGAKQSGLWHHRRWLLHRVFPSRPHGESVLTSGSVGQPLNGEEEAWAGPRGDGEDAFWGVDLSPDGFRVELAVVQRACEVYPRNCHAWAHRYLCAEALAAALAVPGGAGVGERAFAEVWREERACVRVWIERHVADYSAAQYACRLDGLEAAFRRRLGSSISKLESGDGLGVDVGAVLPEVGEGEREGEREESCAHAWTLVRAYPAHESLWLYLRGALALALGPEGCGGDPRGAREDTVARRVLGEAQAFAGDVLSGGKERDETSVLGEGHEHRLVRNHAVRFLGWLLWTEGSVGMDERVVRRMAGAAGGERTSDLLAYLQAGPSK
ncbi:hypothetical protein C8Q79DRAFT_1119992 [Trametes meyenii]|nr:hypothetical protein C8Q79DRAFT_1119992 [Trametes meyenii]